MKSFFITLGQLVFSLVMYCIATVFFGLALIPGVALVFKALSVNPGAGLFMRCLYVGFAVAAGYFLFGFSLIVLAGFVRTALRLRLKEGSYPMFSLNGLKWAFVSSLYLFINFTFVDFILVTPFANIMLRLLGAKLGKNVQINSKFVYDATLLEIGDNTVVGGDAVIISHVVERGRLKLSRVKIGKNVTLGSHSTVMPGCEIGDNAIIGAGAVLLKNTKVEPRSVYYGVPAEPIKPHLHKEENDHAQGQS